MGSWRCTLHNSIGYIHCCISALQMSLFYSESPHLTIVRLPSQQDLEALLCQPLQLLHCTYEFQSGPAETRTDSE